MDKASSRGSREHHGVSGKPRFRGEEESVRAILNAADLLQIDCSDADSYCATVGFFKRRGDFFVKEKGGLAWRTAELVLGASGNQGVDTYLPDYMVIWISQVLTGGRKYEVIHDFCGAEPLHTIRDEVPTGRAQLSADTGGYPMSRCLQEALEVLNGDRKEPAITAPGLAQRSILREKLSTFGDDFHLAAQVLDTTDPRRARLLCQGRATVDDGYFEAVFDLPLSDPEVRADTQKAVDARKDRKRQAASKRAKTLAAKKAELKAFEVEKEKEYWRGYERGAEAASENRSEPSDTDLMLRRRGQMTELELSRTGLCEYAPDEFQRVAQRVLLTPADPITVAAEMAMRWHYGVVEDELDVISPLRGFWTNRVPEILKKTARRYDVGHEAAKGWIKKAKLPPDWMERLAEAVAEQAAADRETGDGAAQESSSENESVEQEGSKGTGGTSAAGGVGTGAKSMYVVWAKPLPDEGRLKPIRYAGGGWRHRSRKTSIREAAVKKIAEQRMRRSASLRAKVSRQAAAWFEHSKAAMGGADAADLVISAGGEC